MEMPASLLPVGFGHNSSSSGCASPFHGLRGVLLRVCFVMRPNRRLGARQEYSTCAMRSAHNCRQCCNKPQLLF
jgi:hypothetical protein